MGIPQINWAGETSMSSWRERSMQRSASVLPPPFVRKMYGLIKVRHNVTESSSKMYLHFHAILVLAIQDFHNLNRLWDGTTTANENSIDIESKRE
jgi:hypothetical protein